MSLTLQAQSVAVPAAAGRPATSSISCSLTKQELAKHPDSLLSSIASDCSASSSSDGINIDLKDVPGWPSELVKPTEAAAVITTIYRMGHFPLEWLQQQLTAPGSSDSAMYNRLNQLLDFLNLPGTVLDWLPLKAITLRHARAMQFHITAAAMMAVEDMMSFPLLTGNSSSRTASLTRQELQKYPESLLASIASSCRGSSAVKIDLWEVSGWPCRLIMPDEATAVIPAMYRTGHFPLEWLQQQLAAPYISDSAIYDKLEQLLDFLNLPGTVLDWLPLTDITLQHVKPLQFYRSAAAKLAVDDMLSFTPMFTTSSSSAQSFAAFLITTAADDALLMVRALKIGNPRELADKVSSLMVSSKAVSKGSAGTLHNVGKVTGSYIAEAKAVGKARQCDRRGGDCCCGSCWC
ncbi:hypothetical protein OEZ86_005804 [Tetradesmus obliquus]|nr:hypothetical protein OEZ86_005804 [Tetradesmus obliquus]